MSCVDSDAETAAQDLAVELRRRGIIDAPIDGRNAIDGSLIEFEVARETGQRGCITEAASSPISKWTRLG
jgi:hypothetical protein